MPKYINIHKMEEQLPDFSIISSSSDLDTQATSDTFLSEEDTYLYQNTRLYCCFKIGTNIPPLGLFPFLAFFSLEQIRCNQFHAHPIDDS